MIFAQNIGTKGVIRKIFRNKELEGLNHVRARLTPQGHRDIEKFKSRLREGSAAPLDLSFGLTVGQLSKSASWDRDVPAEAETHLPFRPLEKF